MTKAWPTIVEQQRETFWHTLTTFSVTRILIVILLLVYLSFNGSGQLIDGGQWFYWEACIAYLGSSLCFAFSAWFWRRQFLWQLMVQVVIDIAVISILYVVSGGSKTGLAILYLFPLAGGAILAPPVLAFFFVSLVTLVLLGEASYALLQMPTDSSLSQVGLYGAAFFVAVFAINRLATRLIKQEVLAADRGIELQLQEAINRVVIADMGDGIMVVSADGKVLTSNPAAENMLALPLPSSDAPLMLSTDSTLAPIGAAFFTWLADAEYVDDQDKNMRSNDVPVFVVIKPINSSAIASAASAASAVSTASIWTKRRDLTVHLKLRFVRVEGEPGPHDRIVIFMQDVSEIDNQAQQLKLASMGRLTASIAHEVRNPLSAISYSASLLLEESQEPQQIHLLKIVADNVTRLNRMIEDILRLSRKANRPDEPLVLAAEMAIILSDFLETQAIASDFIHLAPIGPYRIWFDSLHLREVVCNLLSNALRYASGRPGSISIEVVPISIGRLEMHVQDDGASIAPQIRAHLFEPFYTTSSKGTGLGLYLARELCMNNGAVLDYEYRINMVTPHQPSEVAKLDSADLLNAETDLSGRFVITFAMADLTLTTLTGVNADTLQ
jgi:two-component system sensor histidine kinase PilS (NtrC family)